MNNLVVYFGILGLPPTATEQEIKSAYRRLAKKYHPDLNTGNSANAEEQFARISDAYAKLSAYFQTKARTGTYRESPPAAGFRRPPGAAGGGPRPSGAPYPPPGAGYTPGGASAGGGPRPSGAPYPPPGAGYTPGGASAGGGTYAADFRNIDDVHKLLAREIARVEFKKKYTATDFGNMRRYIEAALKLNRFDFQANFYRGLVENCMNEFIVFAEKAIPERSDEFVLSAIDKLEYLERLYSLHYKNRSLDLTKQTVMAFAYKFLSEKAGQTNSYYMMMQRENAKTGAAGNVRPQREASPKKSLNLDSVWRAVAFILPMLVVMIQFIPLFVMWLFNSEYLWWLQMVCVGVTLALVLSLGLKRTREK